MGQTRNQLTAAVLIWCPDCKAKTPHKLHMDSEEWECLKCGRIHK